MAQHDYVIDNQSFPATRTDLNNLFQAIVTNNSGSSAPSTTFANQIWYDSSANILYMRNEDNDANIPLLQLDQSADVASTLATIIDILDASGTNTAGTDLTIRAGAGTGSGAGGKIILQTADGGSSGSSVNSHATAVTIADDGNVGVGVADPDTPLEVQIGSSGNALKLSSDTDGASVFLAFEHQESGTKHVRGRIRAASNGVEGGLIFETGASSSTTERMRVMNDGTVLIGQTTDSSSDTGHIFTPEGSAFHIRDGGLPFVINRLTDDGALTAFRQDGTTEGSISVSGTTVSYNGGHLSRWSQLTDGTKDTSIVKGTVMTNLDQMAVWSHDAVAATYYVDGDELPEITPATYYTEDDTLPDGVSVGDEKTAAVYAQVGDEKTSAVDAFTEDNEQLNCMAVSSVEGDTNVAGVFVNWDYDDDDFNDMNVAMTGDMVIRIAQGTTVARGDLLMSAGDGTAKPQDDDIVRSKTIAKVTSTHVSHTYDDGSYLVPCVLMAC